MLKNYSITKNSLLKFSKISKRNFSEHAKVLIIGAGSGGTCVASQLTNEKIVKNSDITFIDKADIHYYQPGFTKVGGGVYDVNNKGLIEYDIKSLTSDHKWIKAEATKVDPNSRKVFLDNGDFVSYDYLVMCPGLDVNFNGIPGLVDLLEKENSNVVSVYNYKYALKTAKRREDFKGGRALFTQPPAPIKCAGAPQKLLYLSDAYWKNKGIQAQCHFFTPLPTMFGVKYYSDALEEIANEKGFSRHYKHVLTGFKGDNIATFKDNEKNINVDYEYDFIHVVPPMKAPDVVKNSTDLIDATGFVDIDASMRHKKYDNIYAIGDCVNLPNAKTAAAVFSQAPVLVQNFKEKSQKHQYSGYSACPIFMGNKQLMLAEFSIFKNEKGEVITKPDETFSKGKQTIPNTFFYYLTYSLGYLYHFSHIGRWYGKNHLINPSTKSELKTLLKVTAGVVGLYLLIKLSKAKKLTKS